MCAGLRLESPAPSLSLFPSFCQIPKLALRKPVAGVSALALMLLPLLMAGVKAKARNKQTEGPHGVRAYRVSK